MSKKYPLLCLIVLLFISGCTDKPQTQAEKAGWNQAKYDEYSAYYDILRPLPGKVVTQPEYNAISKNMTIDEWNPSQISPNLQAIPRASTPKSEFIPEDNLPMGFTFMGSHDSIFEINGTTMKSQEGVYRYNSINDIYIEVIKTDNPDILLNQYREQIKKQFKEGYDPFKEITINDHKAMQITDYSTVDGKQKPFYSIVWTTKNAMILITSPITELQPIITLATATKNYSNPIITSAENDLAGRLNLSNGQVQPVTQESVDWPDTSLGYPEKGMMYAQVITPGFRIILKAGDKLYEYHSDYKHIVGAREVPNSD